MAEKDQTPGLMDMQAIEDQLKAKVDQFNSEIPTQPKLAKFLNELDRKVIISVGDEVGFTTRLADCYLSTLTRVALPVEGEHDIQIAMTHETLSDMLTGKLRPIKAYATKKLKVKAKKVKDLLVLKKLLPT